ncbi:MAG TPA: 2-oxo-tetronate isomerase [Magnetospirillaceae bacterium]|jgi:hydroxypyruvate isomerase
MVKLAANLSMLFNEVDFLERFGAAAKAGFKAAEYLFPYAYEAKDLAARLQANGMEQVLFNMFPGNWDKGERGISALPGREDEFRKSVDQALTYAAALKCPKVHVMAGIVPAGIDKARCEATYIENLKFATKTAASAGVLLVLEPLNPTDFAGYFLSSVPQAKGIIDAVGAPNLKVQFDIYHQQMAHGSIASTLKAHFASVGHVQIAGVPGRHEPDEGQEINTRYLFGLLDELGYDGWVGCEYRPRAGTVAGLGWTKAWGITPKA